MSVGADHSSIIYRSAAINDELPRHNFCHFRHNLVGVSLDQSHHKRKIAGRQPQESSHLQLRLYFFIAAQIAK